MDISYTLTLTVRRPVRGGDNSRDELRDVAEWMQSPEAERDLEKEVLRATATARSFASRQNAMTRSQSSTAPKEYRGER